MSTVKYTQKEMMEQIMIRITNIEDAIVAIGDMMIKLVETTKLPPAQAQQREPSKGGISELVQQLGGPVAVTSLIKDIFAPPPAPPSSSMEGLLSQQYLELAGHLLKKEVKLDQPSVKGVVPLVPQVIELPEGVQ
jgi:hypothetical protein